MHEAVSSKLLAELSIVLMFPLLLITHLYYK